MIKKILIFGPQGSGKGTQAELLSKKFELEYVSPGNIFRKEREEKTDIGEKIEEYIISGRLVPDEITNQIITEKIYAMVKQKIGFVLEGFPRNKSQKDALDKVTSPTYVFVIEISDKEAIFRLSGRWSCVCGKTYHEAFHPPKVPGICDACSRKLIKRDDDKPESIQKRLEIYHTQTKHLFEEYEKLKILHRINGEQPIAKVHEDILQVME